MPCSATKRKETNISKHARFTPKGREESGKKAVLAEESICLTGENHGLRCDESAFSFPRCLNGLFVSLCGRKYFGITPFLHQYHMASYEKRGNKWRAFVRRSGVSRTATFPTKSDAVFWATMIEAEILSGKSGKIPDKKFADLLNRYAADVSVNKKGERWERMRLKKLASMPIGEIPLRDLKPTDFAKWRDGRLKEISPASVSREMSLLSHACTIAINEWNWLREHPMQKVRRPAPSKPRDRRITDDEIQRILFACGYGYDSNPGTVQARVGAAFLFAIETAMRAGEIVRLAWENVDLEKRVAQLTETKNGTSRNVPLSSEAIRILKQLPAVKETCFGLTSSTLDALFRKARVQAMIEDLHFHDTRHEAITRLAKKLDVLDLARMVGHRDIKMLMVYYNATAEELAQKLD